MGDLIKKIKQTIGSGLVGTVCLGTSAMGLSQFFQSKSGDDTDLSILGITAFFVCGIPGLEYGGRAINNLVEMIRGNYNYRPGHFI